MNQFSQIVRLMSCEHHECDTCCFVQDMISYRQPVKFGQDPRDVIRPTRTGYDPSQRILDPLQLVNVRCRCAIQNGIAAVESVWNKGAYNWLCPVGVDVSVDVSWCPSVKCDDLHKCHVPSSMTEWDCIVRDPTPRLRTMVCLMVSQTATEIIRPSTPFVCCCWLRQPPSCPSSMTIPWDPISDVRHGSSQTTLTWYWIL
jgi:hypothetical protein